MFAVLLYLLARYENRTELRRKLVGALPRTRAKKVAYLGEAPEFLNHFCDLLNIKFLSQPKKIAGSIEKIQAGVWFDFHYQWAISELSVDRVPNQASIKISVSTEDKSVDSKSWEEKLSSALGKQIHVKINSSAS